MAKRKPGKRADRTGRSAGETRHVRLYHWLTSSAAWRSLGPTSRAVLVELYTLYTGTNNGELFLSVREAAKRVCVGKTAAAASLRELVSKGFIRPRQQGAFSWKAGIATSWVLTEFEFAGQLPTKDFMRWSHAPENQNAVRLQGQGVPPRGQLPPKDQLNGAKCPSSETLLPISAPKASLQADTDSLPQGVVW